MPSGAGPGGGSPARRAVAAIMDARELLIARCEYRPLLEFAMPLLSLSLLAALTPLLLQAEKTDDGPDLSLLQPIEQTEGRQRREGPRAPFAAHYRDGDRELVFIAAKHEQEIDSPTHQLVASVMEHYKPSFVIAEGWPSSAGVSPRRMTQQMERRVRSGRMGESPYAALLAHREGIGFIGGEPDLADQIAELRAQGFETDDMLAFYALRSAASQAENGNYDAIPARTERTLERFAKAMEVPTPTWEDIEAWHEKVLGRPLKLERLNRGIITPRTSKNMTILNEIGIAVEINRETNIIKLETEMLKKHGRILVVYGSGHYNYERALLADWLGEPIFTGKTWPTPEPEAPALSVGPIPEGHLSPFSEVFSKYSEAFGVHVFATEGVSDEKVLHVATVLAEYLDNDEDGTPDNPLVTNALRDRDAFMFLTVDEDELEELEPWEAFEPEGFRFGQFQHAEETLPENGRFDATLEEVLHLVSMGYVEAYPAVYGPRSGTQLAECLDRARGGHFTRVPRRYPKEAWFTYDDRTCDYGCQCIEYLYWAVTSLNGAQADPERCREINREWRPCTPAELRETDPEIVELITDERWAMPLRNPDGEYKPASKNKNSKAADSL